MGKATIKVSKAQTLPDLIKKYGFTKNQIIWLRAASVRTEADLFSFLVTSPELGQKGVFDVPGLTAQLALKKSVTTMLSSAAKFQAQGYEAYGALAPKGAPFQIGEKVPAFSTDDKALLANLEAQPKTLEPAAPDFGCGPWPVLSQGNRGTCVSFATIALYEHYLCRTTGSRPDLSEQFLYWALKHHKLDPYPNDDGTWFRYILRALTQYGTCKETGWPYDPAELPNVSHNPPPPGAVTAAAKMAFAKTKSQSFTKPSGKAKVLLSKLQKHGAVGVALPVFQHPTDTRKHNWNTPSALSYGAVQDPLPGWFVDGGHAVCVVGFAPDNLEPNGGHFIIRNSWGSLFGSRLPDPSYAGPAAGYGQISATHMDKYLWELCVFG